MSEIASEPFGEHRRYVLFTGQGQLGKICVTTHESSVVQVLTDVLYAFYDRNFVSNELGDGSAVEGAKVLGERYAGIEAGHAEEFAEGDPHCLYFSFPRPLPED